MRTLAIDFGEARVGVALSDPEGRVATPLTTLHRRSDRTLIEELARLCDEHEIERLVLGEPRSPEAGTLSPAAERIRRFGAKVEEALGLPIEYVEETLTTVEATERLRGAGVDVRRYPERIDAMAAAIILAEALERWRGR